MPCLRRSPAACRALSQRLQALLGRLVALGRGALVPNTRMARVLGDAAALFVGLGEQRHAPFVALVGALAEALGRFGGVGFDALAIAVEEAEAAEALGVSLVRGFPRPLDGAFGVGADAGAAREGLGEIVLADRVAALGRAPEPVIGLDVVLGHAAPGRKAEAELILRADMAEIAGFAISTQARAGFFFSCSSFWPSSNSMSARGRLTT